MTDEERILLSEYNVQTYLIEGAFTFSQSGDFDALTSKILKDLRENNRFWVRKMGPEEDKLNRHRAIQEYHKDTQNLQCPSLEQKYPLKAFAVPRK